MGNKKKTKEKEEEKNRKKTRKGVKVNSRFVSEVEKQRQTDRHFKFY